MKVTSDLHTYVPAYINVCTHTYTHTCESCCTCAVASHAANNTEGLISPQVQRVCCYKPSLSCTHLFLLCCIDLCMCCYASPLAALIFQLLGISVALTRCHSGVGEMARLAEHLFHKHEELSVTSQSLCKGHPWMHVSTTPALLWQDGGWTQENCWKFEASLMHTVANHKRH